MKKKFSIFIDLAVICLCICALAIGVYSATTAQLTISGTIGFTAHECELDVQISKQGYAYEDDLTQYYDSPQYIDFDSTEETNTIGTLGGKEATIKGPVNLGSMNFTDLAEDTIPPIIVKVTVTNISAYPVSGFVMVEVPINSNITYTRQYSLGDSTTLNDHSSALILNKDASATFVITFKVGAPDQSIDPAKAITITGDFAKYDLNALKTNLKTFNDDTYNLKYTINSANDEYASYTVTTISKDVANVDILSSINHLPVTQIASSAFSSDTTLISAKIPETVTSIGSYAFSGCTKLTSINLPNSIKYIDYEAFYNCSSITGNLVLPNGLTSIGYSAFEGCSGFTGDLIIPDSVTSIDDNAFEGCSGFDGCLFIGNSVSYLGYGAFEKCRGLIGGVIIPDGIKNIYNYTFQWCEGLTSITIPSSVTQIGNNSFLGCTSLTKVNISSLESWCNIDFESRSSNPLYNKANLYLNNQLLTKLNIPSTITKLKPYVFFGCQSFTGDLLIPNNISSIGIAAFEECNGFTGTLTIPNTITTIEGNTFAACGFTGTLTIPDTVTSIGSSAFKNCKGFSGDLIIPEKVTSIGVEAFLKCSGFDGTLTISYGVKNIGNYAFNECRGFTGDLTIPDSVTSLGSYAFYYCSGFDGTLTISNGITTIKEYTFTNCKNLTTIIIPSSVTSIGNYVFACCENLTIICNASNVPTATYAFKKNGFVTAQYDAKINAIYVLPESVDTYKTKAGWSAYASVIQAIQP